MQTDKLILWLTIYPISFKLISRTIPLHYSFSTLLSFLPISIKSISIRPNPRAYHFNLKQNEVYHIHLFHHSTTNLYTINIILVSVLTIIYFTIIPSKQSFSISQPIFPIS